MCWANQRLVAPADSASRHTSSISAVEENPSKKTPTGINHSLGTNRRAAAGGEASSLQPPAWHSPRRADRLRCAHHRNACAEACTTAIGQIALDQFATLLSTWTAKVGSCGRPKVVRA